MSDEQHTQLVAAHRQVFDGLLAATRELDDAGWATSTGCPGWDVHDQLAHCVGLERFMLGDPPVEVEVPDLPHLRDDIGRAIERDVHARRGVPGDELFAEAEETFARRVAQLEQLRPEQLQEQILSPMGPRKTTSALRMRLFDLTSHLVDVHRAVGRGRVAPGPHLDVATEQVLRAWAVGLPAKLDPAGTLAFEVADHGRVTLELPAGTLHRGEGPEADVVLHVTPDELLVLGGGRADAPGSSQLRIDGEEALAQRFLAVAGFTP